MQLILGWVLIIFGGALYLAQIISSVSFPLAQRLGIQEKSATSDTILQRSERYTAYWDIFILLWLPVSGILMVINHHWWPVLSLIGGAVYLDTAGREAAKNLSFKHEGYRVGTEKEQTIFFASYIVMAIIAILVIIYSILHLLNL